MPFTRLEERPPMPPKSPSKKMADFFASQSRRGLANQTVTILDFLRFVVRPLIDAGILPEGTERGYRTLMSNGDFNDIVEDFSLATGVALNSVMYTGTGYAGAGQGRVFIIRTVDVARLLQSISLNTQALGRTMRSESKARVFAECYGETSLRPKMRGIRGFGFKSMGTPSIQPKKTRKQPLNGCNSIW